MALPPLPPRPPTTNPSAPPVPPLPPSFNIEQSTPLAAPRPQKYTPDVEADISRNLTDYSSPMNYQQQQYRVPSWNTNQTPPPPPLPTPWRGGPSPIPPANWRGPSPGWRGPTPSLSTSLSALSFSDPPRVPIPPQPQSRSPSPPRPPSLTAPLPTLASLTAALSSVQSPLADNASLVAWARDVLALVDRTVHSTSTSTDPPPGPIHIPDPQLHYLATLAIPLIISISTPNPTAIPNPVPPYMAEAIALRAQLANSGSFPEFVPQNPRAAFRDFEQAARAGYAPAWFKLGRDYENFGDVAHARDCFERGVRLGVESCIYRMGMAHLMGQLGLPSSPELAVPLLHRAATLASILVPQPAYVYGLLLLSEFSHITIPPALFIPFLSPPLPPNSPPHVLTSALHASARAHLERAAYLNFAPAQYKLGHAYEFALPPFPYDPLLSVQYYSLASQQGEIEADMALSKWFLCGAEGSFDKDEALAWTFAEKAARKGLPSAEFAMGYYAEVGVGGAKDIEAARKWYTKAAQHGNTDAPDRLSALNQPSPQSLSRKEHDNLTEHKLLRKRTQAQARSTAIPVPQQQQQLQQQQRPDAQRVVGVARKASLMSSGPALGPGPGPGQQYQNQNQYQYQYPTQPLRTQQPDTRRPSIPGSTQGPGNLPPRETSLSQSQSQPLSQSLSSSPGSSPSPIATAPPSNLSGFPVPSRQPQHQQQQHQHKYTLSDTGFQPPRPTSGGNGAGGGTYGARAQSQSPHRNAGGGVGGGVGPGIGAGLGVGGGAGAGRPRMTRDASSSSSSIPTSVPPAAAGVGTDSGVGADSELHPHEQPHKTPGLTFEQMGFQSGKLEEKECVIM